MKTFSRRTQHVPILVYVASREGNSVGYPRKSKLPRKAGGINFLEGDCHARAEREQRAATYLDFDIDLVMS